MYNTIDTLVYLLIIKVTQLPGSRIDNKVILEMKLKGSLISEINCLLLYSFKRTISNINITCFHCGFTSREFINHWINHVETYLVTPY